jgi:signal-transduction protein with cAMP-binding, CBS, and nucleotidyltransferase domain
MKERLDFLVKLPGFRMIDKNTLLPLASNMRVKKFRIGEYLVKQREQPAGLIIIYKGSAL